jgi:uncharacterized small protein (DUF1192 family)
MEPEELRQQPDFLLRDLGKQDLYTLSVGDLEERIAALRTEIERCEKALADRGSTRAAADRLFKF